MTTKDERPPKADSRAVSAEGLLDAFWGRPLATMTRREVAVEAAMAAAFVTAAAAAALLLDAGRGWNVPAALALVLAFALASRVEFQIGAGLAVPTQLLLVPMLFLLPLPAVPALVAAALVLGSLPDVLSRRRPAARLLSAVADAWHALGPTVILGLAGPGPASLDHWPLYLGAFGAQSGVDIATSLLRERLCLGISPWPQLRVLALVQVADVLLTPVGFTAAMAAAEQPGAALLLMPLAGLLWLLARDRRARIDQAHGRLVALQRERMRVRTGFRRIGEALAAGIDRPALLEVIVRTAVDAVAADSGRIVVIGETRAADECRSSGWQAEHERQLAAVESRALDEGLAVTSHRGVAAMACRLSSVSQLNGPCVVSVVRTGPPFAESEREALEELAGGAGTSLENADLHERLHQEAVTDGLTGLSNQRRFRERLRREIERSRYAGTSIALVLIDADDFKAINDAYGHLVGDGVLQEIADALRGACRPQDEAARYGGEEFAVLAPGLDGPELGAFADRLRMAVADRPGKADCRAPLPLTVSVGCAALAGDQLDPQVLIRAADAALYEAKRAGKNRVVVSSASGPRVGALED